MNTPMLKVNPKIRIFLRKNSFYAGHLSGIPNPIAITLPDFILISLFNRGAQPDTAAREFVSGKYKVYLPVIPPVQNIIGRIQHFAQQQILVTQMVPGTSVAEETTFTLSDCPDVKAFERTVHLRVGKNIALEPAQDGFSIWSPLKEKHYLLDIEFAAIFSALNSVKSFSQLTAELKNTVNEATLKNAVSWLLEGGLILEADVPVPEEIPPATDKSSNTGSTKTGLSIKTLSWQEMQPDGRIPVYFTPHMRNHYPLALGMISSYIEAYNGGMLLNKYQLIPITYLSPQEYLDGPYKKFGPGVWMFSNYMWSIDLNMEMSKRIKAGNANNITIHGGPSTPNYEQASIDFMNENSSIDISVHGEGEAAAAEILANLVRQENGKITYNTDQLKHVNGITFRETGSDASGLHRTGKRERIASPDDIPSPYLQGIFNTYNADVDAAIIESNRGCPFGCTFCDWGSATNQKVRKFDLERVKHEIEWIGRNNVPVLWIADANFGMYDRDIELAKWICEIKEKYGYPSEVVVNYTKNATRRLAEIIKAFTAGGIISQGIISIQTTDDKTLEVINRKNIKIEKYDELTKIFTEENLPLSTDLMIGLPGITTEAFDQDLQRYFDVDVLAKAYPTQLLPNSPMADPEYLEKYKIEVDENDFLISCYSYTKEDLEKMKAIYNTYVVADGYCTLRYVLRYLQWEHNIPALEFLQSLRKEIRDYPNRYPSVTWAMNLLVTELFLPGGWINFYNEIAQFAYIKFNIERDSAFDTILYVNELVMPDNMKSFPITVNIDHDINQYMHDHNAKHNQQVKPLKSYDSASFTVEDPDKISEIDSTDSQYDSHQYFWELNSSISRIKSTSGAKIVKRKAASG